MNANGNTRRPSILKDVNIPAVRHETKVTIIESEDPDIILIQESPTKIRKILTGYKWKNNKHRGIQSANGRDYKESETEHKDGIIYDYNRFDVFEEQDSIISDFTNILMRNAKYMTTSINDIITRMAAVVLKIRRKPTVDILVISWHGKYRWRKESIRKDIIRELLRSTRMYMDMKGITFAVIGGDFNVELTPEDTDSFYHHLGFYTLENQPTGRRRDIIDYIMVTPTNEYIPAKAINPIHQIREATEIHDISSSDTSAILDHDPIYADLTLTVAN